MSEINLPSIQQEALSRMSPYQLAERAVALCMQQHNALGLEPVTHEGDTLYPITSGVVAQVPLTARAEIQEAGTVTWTHASAQPLRAFADVVRLSSPARDDVGNAFLCRLERDVDPVLASRSAPFRATMAAALRRNVSGGTVKLPFDKWGVSYVIPDEIPEETDAHFVRLGSTLHPLLATGNSKLHVVRQGMNNKTNEVLVETFFRGLVRARVPAYNFARLTDERLFIGPPATQKISFEVPETVEQQLSGKDAFWVPREANIVPEKDGVIAMSGPRTQNKAYKQVNLQPHISHEDLLDLTKDDIEWRDVTGTALVSLASQLAYLLPLADDDVSYRRTLARARDRLQTSLAAETLTPVMGGVGCLAVAARLTDLPGTIEDHPFEVDQDFFHVIR